MITKTISTLALVLVALCVYGRVELPDKINAIWFANWAQYRHDRAFVPANMTSIINDVDIIYYAFAFFCPNSSMFQPYWITDPNLNYCAEKSPFEVIWIEPKDPDFYKEIIEFKQTNGDLKVVLSVGGWNFPSNFFSEMVSNEDSRSTFIKSVVNVTSMYGFDGIDIDWEYPNSSARLDPVEMYCDKDKHEGNSAQLFHNITDEGGDTADKVNFVLLMKELREALGENMLITFCGQAGLVNVRNGFDIESLVEYVDLINIMTYDYTVSATGDASEGQYTAPNEPVFQPRDVSNIAIWNINSTINGYLEMGAPADQLLVGIAFYGHTWYIPGLSTNNVSSYNHYAIEATKPGNKSNCCGILAEGWGGSAGNYTLQCGFNGYFEIQAAGFLGNAQFDNDTKTYISYIDQPGDDDGWTPANTWINYQGIESVKAIINFANKKQLRGAFGFDVTTDSYDKEAGWTFDLTKQMYSCLKIGC